MLNNYIKVSSEQITKATPSGYDIRELKKDIDWSTYNTNEFTDRDFINIDTPRDTPDFSISNSESGYTVTNLFDVFINSRAVITDELNGKSNSLNISSKWDKSFPETIRLKYPGVITNKDTSSRQKLENEKTYSFKIWENRSNNTIDKTNVIPADMIPNSVSRSDYFYELLSFIKVDNNTSHEDWLKRPSFSLKGLLSKGIKKNDILYQLYRVNDVNVQSLSTDFDEYVPWCFDQSGSKIEQYKIATITSFNKKEIYILLALNVDDVTEINDVVSIPVIENIVFWRSGISDKSIMKDIRNKDQMLLLDNGKVSNISEYFKESKIDTNTLVNFQRDRLENDMGDNTPIDNDVNNYELEYNEDSYFSSRKTKNSSYRLISGKNTNVNINISMGGESFSDHFKNRVHIFVDGNLLTYDEFYILNGYIHFTLSNIESYTEIFIDQYDSITYTFNLTTARGSLTENQLSNILYNAGLLWKTTKNKKYLLFNKDANSNKLVNGSAGNYLIIHTLLYDLETDTAVPNPIEEIGVAEDATNVNNALNYNINYDPLLYKTSVQGGESNINDKDVWLFDNTNHLIKTEDYEPFIEYVANKIKVMSETDPNIGHLDENSSIHDLKTSLEGEAIHKEIMKEAEKTYLTTHYAQMSTVNRNILNMFMHSGASTWDTLNANEQINVEKDYLIIRYTGSDSFPLLTIHKNSLYEFERPIDSLQVKVKPAQVGEKYYILHRTDDESSNIYKFSFNKSVEYIEI